MSEQEKAWLKKLLTDLREGKDVETFRHSSYLSTLRRKLEES
jgi:hypothetical protein